MISLNPHTSIYFEAKKSAIQSNLYFSTEVTWAFLKALDNGLKLTRHRVNIKFSERINAPSIQRFASIFEYSTPYNKALFEGKSEQEMRFILLNTIYEGFVALAEEFEWDKPMIEKAYLEAKQEQGYFHFTSARKLSRNRKLQGSLQLTLKARTLTIAVIIMHANGERISERILLETDEDNLSWYRRIKEYGWYDSHRFGLKFLGGELWIVLNLETDQIEEIVSLNKVIAKDMDRFLRELKELPVYR